MLTKDDYLAFRRRFEPTNIELVIIAQSPPKTGKYFYNPEGLVSELLFKALMEQLSCSPKTKEEGLREFQRRGWVLVDATYEPVDRLPEREANRIIERDYDKLVATLNEMSPDKLVPIILVKKNVCNVLDEKLRADGFNVLNKGQGVSFPGSGRQKEFRIQFSAILGSDETLTDGNRSQMPQQKRPRTGMKHQRKRHGVSDHLFTVKGFGVKGFGKDVKWFGKQLKWLVKGLKQGHVALIEGTPEIANRYGLDEERYRQSLRQQAENDPRLSWHDPGERWEAPIGSPGHDAMIEVAERLAAQSP